MSAEHRVDEHRVERLRLPDSASGPDAADFLEYSRVAAVVSEEIWGNGDRCESAEYQLAVWGDTADELTSLFFVRDGARMAGLSWCRMPLREDTERAMVHVEVPDACAGRGIGRSLLAAAWDEAVRHGRTLLNTFTEHPPGFDADAPGVVVPSTGAGALPAAARGVAFALAAGFELSQIERVSELVLGEHDAAWPALEATAAAKSDRAYEVLLWEGIPAEHRAHMAVLLGRMSTDVPYGADRYEEAVWDGDRVASLEARLARVGTRPLYAVARHRASGSLVGYTALLVRDGRGPVADQDDTLVFKEHRGHALGLRLKLANLAALRARCPHVRRVLTSNAEENGHMLAINTALGFRPVGYEGEWYRSAA